MQYRQQNAASALAGGGRSAPLVSRTTQETTAMHRAIPPFRADHVGSLLRPKELLAARARHQAGEISAAELRAVEDRAIRHAVKLQEDVGLSCATDGEYRRAIFHVDFLKHIHGVTVSESEYKVKFRAAGKEIDFAPPVLGVASRLALPDGGIAVEDFRFLGSVTKRMPKLCIPSPSMLHFRGGRGAVDKSAYPDIEEFFSDLARVYRAEIAALAAAGCKYVQLDDTNLAYLCDPEHRARAKSIGEDPDRLPSLYAKLISDSLRDRPKDMVACIHLCRGNFQSAWVAEGSYETVAETLFNEIDVDGFFLEYDDARSGGFEPLRFVPKGKTVVLGLVTSKRPELESKSELKQRIEEAAKHMPIEALALSPQCGFSSSEHGNDLTEEQEIAKLRLVVETAAEVWG
jgi:5-methyltetrahydropteroyltriglutamate--homocysteine methyltransferase